MCYTNVTKTVNEYLSTEISKASLAHRTLLMFSLLFYIFDRGTLICKDELEYYRSLTLNADVSAAKVRNLNPTWGNVVS